MASFGNDGSELGIAFRTRSSTVHLAAQFSPAAAGAVRGPLVRHGLMTTGSQAALSPEPLPASQLPQLPPVPLLPSAAPAHALQPDPMATLASTSVPPIAPVLTSSQRGELELAKTRAERAAAGRARGGSSAAAAAGTSAHWSAPASGVGVGGKRHRGGNAAGGGGAGAGDVSLPNSDDEDGGDHSDGELELSRLSPEEQERVLTARLAGGGAGGSNKDARRLKRLLRNRVSAQQARERKKQYVSSLEDQLREQQSHIGLLEKRLEAVESQNESLRNIIMTMRGYSDNPPAGAAAIGAAAAGGPTGRSPGGAAARPPAGRAPAAAARDAPRPQPPPQQQQQGFRAGPGVLGGTAAGAGGRPGSNMPQPPLAQQQHRDQVVPELFPAARQDLDAPRHPDQPPQLQEQLEDDQPWEQQQAPATRHSRAQLLGGPHEAACGAAVAAPALQQPPAAAAGMPYHGGLYHAAAAPPPPPRAQVPERFVDGSSSSPHSFGFGATPTAAGADAAGPPGLPTQGVDELRYPTPVLGQLPPDLDGMSYGFDIDEDAVPPSIEVPDCVDVDF